MDEKFEENLTSTNTWVRAIFMLLFAIIYELAELVVFAIALFQFLYKLFTGEPNQPLLNLGKGLSLFAKEIVEFLTFNSEHKPFPFAEWPGTAENVKKPPKPAAKKKIAAKKKSAS